MKAFFLLLGLALSLQAHAGLFSDLQSQENARNEQARKQNDASREAYVEGVTKAWLIKNLNMPQGTSVRNEGVHDQEIGWGTEYNIGGQWGCVVFPPNGLDLQVSCLSTNGQRHNFSRGPIDKADDNWYCIHYPDINSSCHVKRKKK